MERRHDTWARRVAIHAVALLPLLAAACGGDSTPTTPTPTTFTLQVQVRDEQSKPVTGALVRITDGLNAGRNATTDQSGAVSLSGLSGGGFTIEVTASGYGQSTQGVTLTASLTVTVQLKLTPNTPPMITALVAKGNLPNEPPNYSNAGEALTVTATVSDAESTADQLTFEWKADSGTFTGTGPSVKWQPASAGGSGGVNALLTLTVIEKYGPSNSLENKATSTLSVTVHDAAREVGAMAYDFLVMFSNSGITDPNVVLRDFSSTCAGTNNERDDVIKNRQNFTIQSSSVGNPAVTVYFGGTCPFRARPGDACASVPVEWHSVNKVAGDPNFGKVQTAKGTDQVTGVYQNGRWWLCDSDFESSELHYVFTPFKK